MPIDARIPMGFQPIQVEPPMNNLMRFMQLKGMQQDQADRAQRNRLQEMQAQQQERERANALAQQEARNRFLMDQSGAMGPAAPLNPAAAMAAGLNAQEIGALQGPKPPTPMVLGPGASIRDPMTGRVIAEQPFKPEAPKVPEIGQLQAYRDTLPQGDPRRREVDALIGNMTRPPKAATTAPSAAPMQSGVTPANDRAQLSAQLGVPIAERDPFAGMTEKGAEVFRRSLYTSAEKRLNEVAESASAAREMARDAQRFLTLQQQVTAQQGPIMGRTMAITPESQEMDAITAKITPQMRQPGSGATSDFDAKMFMMSTVQRTKNDAANEAIGNGIILSAQNAQDREQFLRDYLTVNGHLDGADRQWRRYVQANPIFDPKSPNVPRLNPARVPYQAFFSGQRPANPPAGGAPAGGGASNQLTPAEQAELEQLRKRFNRN